MYKDKTIESVSDFLAWVKETNSVEAEKGLPFEQSNSYYRGQACLCWELKPSLFRDSQVLDEHSMLKKATLRLWNEVVPMGGYLEKMVFFQHYGLSTRLLDVTFNPLVALYFACCGEFTHDGVVYCGYNTDNQNTQIAELSAEYVFTHEMQPMVYDFQRFAEDNGVKIEDFTRPLFILPPINNPRIEAQNGAFVMAPLFEKFLEDKTGKAYRKGFDDPNIFDERIAIIPKDVKKSMLHELSILGIDSGTIYKGIEGKLKAIVAEEKWKATVAEEIHEK